MYQILGHYLISFQFKVKYCYQIVTFNYIVEDINFYYLLVQKKEKNIVNDYYFLITIFL